MIVPRIDYEKLDEPLKTERYMLVLKFTEKYGESFLVSHVRDRLRSVPTHQREEYSKELKKLVEKYGEYLRLVANKN